MNQSFNCLIYKGLDGMGRSLRSLGPHAAGVILALVAMLAPPSASARSYLNVRFNNEGADTLEINAILADPLIRRASAPGDRLAMIGRRFIDVPYKARTLERVPEKTTVNTDSLDCTTFVETVLALGKTVGEQRDSWRDFVDNLTSIRYRGGEVNGYPSRLHYISDWTVDNGHRDNFREVTSTLPKVKYEIRTIDFMSRHRDSYPALADSADFERIRSIEEGYHLHRFPYIKTRDLGNKLVREELKNGDVVAFVSNRNDLDVTHMGMIVTEPDGEFHVLHASMNGGKVMISDLPLTEFMRRNRSFIGIRVYRLLQ